MGSNPSAGTKFDLDGDEREMESGLIFNQLICEFESRHPCHCVTRNCGREVRHLVVNQADDGSSPFSSAKINFGGVV